MNLPPPEHFPLPWASDWGEDELGYWMAFTYKGVRQAFRWIGPGTFLMGSPDDEHGRYDDERQHEVTLSQGFWLAETACTQALWRAVTGENPSRFQGDEQPVENVSWDDAKDFIQRLNDQGPGLNLRLPSEAQWEYACRAGTRTPFSFGEDITLEQVNYDGNYPYRGGKKGLFRGKTVEVASLSPNPWGLFEMHGNVWEWCEDWYGDYPAGPVTDPEGSTRGEGRVLRGGSWFGGGRDVRSACRGNWGPGRRGDLGFRLARGPEPGKAGSGAGVPRP